MRETGEFYIRSHGGNYARSLNSFQRRLPRKISYSVSQLATVTVALHSSQLVLAAR